MLCYHKMSKMTFWTVYQRQNFFFANRRFTRTAVDPLYMPTSWGWQVGFSNNSRIKITQVLHLSNCRWQTIKHNYWKVIFFTSPCLWREKSRISLERNIFHYFIVSYLQLVPFSDTKRATFLFNQVWINFQRSKLRWLPIWVNLTIILKTQLKCHLTICSCHLYILKLGADLYSLSELHSTSVSTFFSAQSR